MYRREDTTFHELRQKSVNGWLEAMLEHEDLEVRGGVRVTQDYILALEDKIHALEKSNKTKETYLRKMKRV